MIDNEAGRLTALYDLDILDTTPERVFDQTVQIATGLLGTPMGAITFIDRDRQWFKAEHGIGVDQTARDVSFCTHTIQRPGEVTVIEDAPNDRRFATNPFVTGAPFVRFYAGAPLVSSDGCAVGSLCVLDTEARGLTPEQRHALKILADQTMTLLEGRRDRRRLNDALQRITADLMPWQI